MTRPVEAQMTISCLQCDWSVETVNTSAQVSSAFLEAAVAHADEQEQHALEVVQRLRIYSENYVEPEPMEQNTRVARDTAARRDAGIQTSFLDRRRREHRYGTCLWPTGDERYCAPSARMAALYGDLREMVLGVSSRIC